MSVLFEVNLQNKKGNTIPTGGFINTEGQYEVCTKNLKSTGEVETNDQTEKLTAKGIKGQKI